MLHPWEATRDIDRQMHHRSRAGRLPEPAEAGGRAHLGGDQIGHVVDVFGVDVSKLKHFGDSPLGRQVWPRPVVKGLSCHTDSGVNVAGRTGCGIADDVLGVGRDHVDARIAAGPAPAPPTNMWSNDGIRASAGFFGCVTRRRPFRTTVSPMTGTP